MDALYDIVMPMSQARHTISTRLESTLGICNIDTFYTPMNTHICCDRWNPTLQATHLCPARQVSFQQCLLHFCMPSIHDLGSSNTTTPHNQSKLAVKVAFFQQEATLYSLCVFSPTNMYVLAIAPSCCSNFLLPLTNLHFVL